MDPILDPQWYKMWPTKNIPDLTSPPKGRTHIRKNVHTLSSDSESDTQEVKKQKTEDLKKVVKLTSIFNKKEDKK